MADALEVLDEVRRRFEEAAERTRAVPEASPPVPPRRITVGMAAYDDFDGVFFTVESLPLYHPEVAEDLAVVVVDNHPEGPDAAHLKRLDRKLPGFRYVPFRGFRGTAVRDRVFREANSEIVVCVDSHVLLRPGALRAIAEHLEASPDDLVHGPLLNEDLSLHATEFAPSWNEGMYGEWHADPRGADPAGAAFEIGMSGLGIFACRRDRWPGLHPHFRGFGGEEGYLHEKFRQLGGRVVCLPAAGYVHRFARPSGTSYRNAWEDRIRNYLIGWHELGLDPAPVEAHFRELLGADVADPAAQETRAELANPLASFDAVFCLQLDGRADEWPDVWARFEEIGLGNLVERFPAIETPDNHHDGCARSHRAMVAEAQRRGLRNVLVFEEDAIFRDDALDIAQRALDDLRGREWDVLFFGGVHRRPPNPVDGSSVLEEPTYLTTSHAVAYNSTCFDRILTEIPTDDDDFATWLEKHVAIDQYLPTRIREGALNAFVTNPRMSAQPWMLQYEDAELAAADRYPSA